MSKKQNNDGFSIEILSEVKVDKNGKLTAAVGEASNHNHAFMDPTKVSLFNARIKDPISPEGRDTMVAVIKDTEVEFSHYNSSTKKALLTQEHATIVAQPMLKGSVFEVVRQVEVNDDEEIVQVAD